MKFALRKKQIMNYNKREQIEFIKQVIDDYQIKANNASDNNSKYMLNDIIDLYSSVLDTLESK